MLQNINFSGIQSGNIDPDSLARLHDVARHRAHQLRREAITHWSDSLLTGLAEAARRLTRW